jgi:hypothetical protein
MVNLINRWHRSLVVRIATKLGIEQDTYPSFAGYTQHATKHTQHTSRHKHHTMQHKHHHPYREPKVLKGVQHFIGNIVGKRLG